MSMHERISQNPEVMMGKPVIAGTRITVEVILRWLSLGQSEKDILASYPGLVEEDIRAAQAFAADFLSHEVVLAAG